MASGARLSRLTPLAAGAALLVLLALQPSLRCALAQWTGLKAPGGRWRLVAIILALANLKTLPFGWHVRFFRGLILQLYLQPTPIPPHALFQPAITSSQTVLLETDYNLHKSNSTYFADIDISRTHLFFALFRNGVRKDSPRIFGGSNRAAEQQLDPSAWYGLFTGHAVILGAVSCSFRREIAPYQKYDMWSRVLAWDRKWLFIVTHLVKPGVARPATYTLQPWRRGTVPTVQAKDQDEAHKQTLRRAVLATCLSKYVIKKDRQTVSPELALMRCNMLPPKPDGWVFSGAQKQAGVATSESDWTWDTIEAERQHGLRFAYGLTALDALDDVFDGGAGGVLGKF